jgi:hypothetical protein
MGYPIQENGRRYNRFIMKNKQYADISNGVIKFLPSMTGGRTRRKTRRRRTRHLR